MCFDLLFCVSFLFYEQHNMHNAALPLQSRQRFHKSWLHFDLANIEHILTKIQSKITLKQPFKKKIDIILYFFSKSPLTFLPSFRLVNIMIWFTSSCQTMHQKSDTVFGVGPIIHKKSQNKKGRCTCGYLCYFKNQCMYVILTDLVLQYTASLYINPRK